MIFFQNTIQPLAELVPAHSSLYDVAHEQNPHLGDFCVVLALVKEPMYDNKVLKSNTIFMTTISVPLNAEVEKDLKELTEITGANRVAVIRKAIKHYREEEAINAVLRAEQEVSEGKLLRGTTPRGLLST